MRTGIARAAFVTAFLGLTAADSGTAHHWSYAGPDGPSHWGGACKSGKSQSPIGIETATVDVKKLPPLVIDYRPGTLHVIDNGHTVQVNVDKGSSMTVGGHRFELVQFHFHKPSEETIDGRHFAMVAHLVHRDLKGDLAVIAVPLRAGAANPVIETVWRYLPHEKGRERSLHGVSISPGQLLPANRAYFTYMGSLTTPPCTEGVRWFVLKAPTSVSLNQITTFSKLYRANARPVQPLNRREVDASG
ncbi:MAG TPA: carbonic anhydrase family protein [Sphingomicrobium sp.]|nr:carbonic anhydrase family protein [Sphingomicrobium sp.]